MDLRLSLVTAPPGGALLGGGGAVDPGAAAGAGQAGHLQSPAPEPSHCPAATGQAGGRRGRLQRGRGLQPVLPQGLPAQGGLPAGLGRAGAHPASHQV